MASSISLSTHTELQELEFNQTISLNIKKACIEGLNKDNGRSAAVYVTVDILNHSSLPTVYVTEFYDILICFPIFFYFAFS